MDTHRIPHSPGPDVDGGGAPPRLELLEVLGEGGGGVVHAARLDGAEVAVKVLHAELALSPKERRRFLDEAAIMRRVRHPAVVPLVGQGELDDGRPWLAMPRLRGETLQARLARGPLPLAVALEHFDWIAGGVSALHRAGLIHRDVKPDNVFLEELSARPVLLDFGIARDVHASPSTTTQAGVTRGTPAYMAPERFFGAPATIRSDVYELAVLLFMMLTGRTPWFDGKDPAQRLQVTDPRVLAPDVPHALAAALFAALSTRPEARPESVDAFAARVRASLAAGSIDGHTTEALTGDEPRARERRAAARRRVARWAVGGVAVAVGGVGLASLASRASGGAPAGSAAPAAPVAELATATPALAPPDEPATAAQLPTPPAVASAAPSASVAPTRARGAPRPKPPALDDLERYYEHRR